MLRLPKRLSTIKGFNGGSAGRRTIEQSQPRQPRVSSTCRMRHPESGVSVEARTFTYVIPDGRLLTDDAELKRIASLAIPPAYEDVWICTDPRGHLQATGRDARGRKQYRYHPRWRLVRDGQKFDRMPDFRRSAAAAAPAPSSGPRAPRTTAGKGTRARRKLARRDADAHRQCRVRARQRQLRTHDAAQPACPVHS